MKVGPHGDETLSEIFQRKILEEAESVHGYAYWGYGGAVCHPTRQVQPFASIARGEVGVIFIETTSNPFLPPTVATQLSVDSVKWLPISSGRVTSSKWALTLHELRLVNTEIDLAEFEVAIGPSEGRILSDYLKGRCDKGCVRRREQAGLPPYQVRVIATARLCPPYAVFLK